MRARPRGRNAILRPSGPAPQDPYSPGSRDYEERHRVTERVHPSGLVQVDMGEPSPPYPTA